MIDLEGQTSRVRQRDAKETNVTFRLSFVQYGMSHSYTRLVYHIVFATKHRYPWLVPTVEDQVIRTIRLICEKYNIVVHCIGCGNDHVHIVISFSPTLALSSVMQRIKGESSFEIRRFDNSFRDFAWQEGYFASTVNPMNMSRLKRYILSQRSRHR
jgi:REP element-mobilizing transposase RayT